MIYLIGGPARTGKTSLAQLLTGEYGIPFLSTDALAAFAAGGAFSDRAFGLVDHVAYALPDYCVEGDLVTCSFAVRVGAIVETRACFLGRPDVTGADLLAAPGRNAWVQRCATAELERVAERIREDSRRLRRECARLRLPFFEGHGQAFLRRVAEALVAPSGRPRPRGAPRRGARRLGSDPREEVHTGRSLMVSTSVREVMTPNPIEFESDAPIDAAAKAMREWNVGDVVVLDRGQLCGILTDRDIVLRTVAEGRDPRATRLGDVCSQEVTAIAPEAAIEEAVELMRSKAVRRLPVLEDGRVVGMVSLGDLALVRDPDSVLADVSAAPPNR